MHPGLAHAPTLQAEAASGWFAVQVKRHREDRVREHLTLRAIPVFLPFIEVPRRRGELRHRLLEPLFPGYLFARLEPVTVDPQRWHAVRWTPGVRAILGSPDGPVPVPETVISAIQERVKRFGFVRREVSYVPLMRVRFVHGPFAGLEALSDRPLSRQGRIRVLMRLLGKHTRVEVDLQDLERA